MQIKEFVAKVKSKEIDILDYTSKVLQELEKTNNEYHYLSNISKELALYLAKKVSKDPSGKLAGVPISVKDCICIKGLETSACSTILKGYKPVFTATVVNKLIKEGAIIVGKTIQDEFGFGSFCTNIGNGFSTPLNPFDKERCCGGSSGGSAGITKKSKNLHISIAESTGGSIACPASFCGIVGFTPTYGLLSRNGLIDYGSSLDKIGPMAKNINDCQTIFEIIKGQDIKDPTSKFKILDTNKPKTFAIIKEAFEVDSGIKEIILKKLSNLGFETKEISLPYVKKYAIPAYYIISMAEASTNLAKFCGLRYGLQMDLKEKYNEYFSKVRSQGFSKEAKRRILIGTFARMAGYRDAYYLKALKVRQKIINEYKKAFKKNEILISPSMPILPPKFTEIEKLAPIDTYQMDQLTVGPNLAGLPHISINAGFKEELPIGMMLIGDHFNDNSIFTALGEYGEN
ncbi:MAG: amidase family protein [Nanoarchaeota archaeon]|nr:amidase family protein [Nanoarchaeota archaeon]